MSVRLFIAIVSHGHAHLLARSLPGFFGIANTHLCVVDNLGQSELQTLCRDHDVAYLTHDNEVLGFGANNNTAFRFFQRSFELTADDYFVCCNPDVLIAPTMINELSQALSLLKPQLAGINLFTDEKMQQYDPSIRSFPRAGNYVCKVLKLGGNTALDKATVFSPVMSDWAAGSFLVFSVPLFAALKGFDERFFMYFEDVDICLRAWREQGQRLLYLPHVKAVHFAALRNRRLFSKHFYWYFSSLLRYFWRLYLGRSRSGAVSQ